MVFGIITFYMITGLVTAGLIVYLYMTATDNEPPHDGDDDGGLPAGGDTIPRSDIPPSLTVRHPDEETSERTL